MTDNIGLGQLLLLIVHGHWNNLLAAGGLLDLATDPLYNPDNPHPQNIFHPGYDYLKAKSNIEPDNGVVHLANAKAFMAKNTLVPGYTSPVITGMYFFMPVYAAYSNLNYLLGDVIDGWMIENNNLGHQFPTWSSDL